MTDKELKTLREMLDKDNELSEKDKDLVMFIAENNKGEMFTLLANMLQKYPVAGGAEND
nr:MAG TPA: hypothetical protein [Caudoviricetes sp.]